MNALESVTDPTETTLAVKAGKGIFRAVLAVLT